MRLIIANPHIHLYGNTVSRTLLGIKTIKKYFYVMDNFIKNENRPVAFLIDGTRSSFNELGIRLRIFPTFFAYIELIFWMFINGLNPFKYKVFFNVDKLDPSKDVILNCVFTTLDNFKGNHNHLQFHRYKGIVINYMTHYLSDPSKVNSYLKKIKKNFVVAESDLTRNEFFRHYFPDIKEVYHLPFAWQARFERRIEFSKRRNKCLGLGTFVNGRSKDFRNFFGENSSLHPMRKKIYEKQKELKPYIDCYMYDLDRDKKFKELDPKKSFLNRFAKRFLPSLVLARILPSHQSRYLMFDMVRKQNSYKMFTVPEEIIGLPSSNVFEGMACGTVFLGTDDPMYTDLGMENGVHYLAYKKDSLEDLVRIIRYGQRHPRELEKIAEQGKIWVQRFKPEKVASIFWNDLENLVLSSKRGKPQFFCSFKMDP